MLISLQPSLRRRGIFAVGLASVVASLALVACASSGKPTPAGGSGGSSAGSVTSSSAGAGSPATTIEVRAGHLADGTGRTVYLWSGDKGATSSCEATCATYWPPVLTSGAPLAGVGALVADLGTTKRTDGRLQVTYRDHPLYYFEGDKTAGLTTGQGMSSFGAKWWEVSAAGTAIKPSSASTSPTSGAPKATTSTHAMQPPSHPTTHTSSKPKPPPTHSSPKPTPTPSSSGYGY